MLYIHIGFHKTGSTTIQEFCHSQRKALLNAGINYKKLRDGKRARIASTPRGQYDLEETIAGALKRRQGELVEWATKSLLVQRLVSAPVADGEQNTNNSKDVASDIPAYVRTIVQRILSAYPESDITRKAKDDGGSDETNTGLGTNDQSEAASEKGSSAWATVREKVLAHPKKNFLVSSEALHSLTPRRIEEVGAYLSGIPVIIIAYIRPIIENIVSTYSQRAKVGSELGNFDEYFASRSEWLEEDGIFLQLERWATVFGWDCLRVRSLDRRNLAGSDLLTDLLAAVGIDIEALDADPDARRRRNTSPGWKTVELIRAMQAKMGPLRSNLIDLDQHEFDRNRGITSTIRWLGEISGASLGFDRDRGDYLDAEQRDLCAAAYARQVAMINERLPEADIPLPKAMAATPRFFMPEASRVPPAECFAFFEIITSTLEEVLACRSQENNEEVSETYAAHPTAEAAKLDSIR